MGDIEGLERLLDEARSSAALLTCLRVGDAVPDTNIRVLIQRIPETANRRILEKRLSTRKRQVRPWRNSWIVAQPKSEYPAAAARGHH